MWGCPQLRSTIGAMIILDPTWTPISGQPGLAVSVCPDQCCDEEVAKPKWAEGIGYLSDAIVATILCQRSGTPFLLA